MRQRLQFFPRVRSNSISTLTVTPPASTSRPVLSSPPRLPSEAPKQSQHSQLALTQPTPGLHPPLFPSTQPISQNFNPVPANTTSSLPHSSTDTPRAHKRQRLQYQLDVGAYGIAKHRSQTRAFHSSSSYPHTSLSVQVGEDAYFIRDNAMGIADGVGGWSKIVPNSSQHPTPSALFSRRLMHFCSAELEALEGSASDNFVPNPHPSTRPPTAQFSFQHHLKPRSPPSPPPHDSFSFSDLEDSLHSSLEELSEGINILNILERAYDNTVKSHLAPSTPTPTPLTTGSSTALLAVLDHPPSGPLTQNPEAPHKNYAAGSLSPADLSPLSKSKSDESEKTDSAEDHTTTLTKEPYDAVVRIAHLGDCMGMLIREDTIAWRSDEMWWGYNHPLQLGPPSASSSSKSPQSNGHLTLPVQPHTFTLPVRADDILILASDGLSDNLWDEDVLDEVLKFRQKQADGSCGFGFGFGFHPSGGPHKGPVPVPVPVPESVQALQAQIMRRKAFAGMLSEALCSRAKRVSEMKTSFSSSGRRSRAAAASPPPQFSVLSEEEKGKEGVASTTPSPSPSPSPTPSMSFVTSESEDDDANEIPFAHRAKLAGKVFKGGKHDDISVIVAVISPLHSPSPSTGQTQTQTTGLRFASPSL